MKVRYEDESILIDTNCKGWNPEVLVEEVSEDYYNTFIVESETTYGSLEDMELKDAVDIIILLAQNNIIN